MDKKNKVFNDFSHRKNEIVGKIVKCALIQGDVDWETATTFADIEHCANYVSDVSIYENEQGGLEAGAAAFHYVKGGVVTSFALFTDDDKKELIFAFISAHGLPLYPIGKDVVVNGVYELDLGDETECGHG